MYILVAGLASHRTYTVIVCVSLYVTCTNAPSDLKCRVIIRTPRRIQARGRSAHQAAWKMADLTSFGGGLPKAGANCATAVCSERKQNDQMLTQHHASWFCAVVRGAPGSATAAVYWGRGRFDLTRLNRKLRTQVSSSVCSIWYIRLPADRRLYVHVAELPAGVADQVEGHSACGLRTGVQRSSWSRLCQISQNIRE